MTNSIRSGSNLDRDLWNQSHGLDSIPQMGVDRIEVSVQPENVVQHLETMLRRAVGIEDTIRTSICQDCHSLRENLDPDLEVLEQTTRGKVTPSYGFTPRCVICTATLQEGRCRAGVQAFRRTPKYLQVNHSAPEGKVAFP
jgi:hypothetical protein